MAIKKNSLLLPVAYDRKLDFVSFWDIKCVTDALFMYPDEINISHTR